MSAMAMIVDSPWTSGEHTTFTSLDCPQQLNAVDCGIYAVAAMEALVTTGYVSTTAPLPQHLLRENVTAP